MKKLRIHYFQHIGFEGLGCIEEWTSSSGHSLSTTKFFENEKLPRISDFDWLIIMGGPMSVHDEDQYPWLVSEKRFIREAIDAGKIVLGICLGSQLVSAALGAKVYKNSEIEIGWFDIEPTCFAKSGSLQFLPEVRTKVFHWHGDTFDIPVNAIHLAYSKGCKNQAYIYKDKVLALQFHLEPTAEMICKWIENAGDNLSTGNFVQSEKEILDNFKLIDINKKILFELLERLAEQA
jgi:GMP synthase-like glutamine amidotransferase